MNKEQKSSRDPLALLVIVGICLGGLFIEIRALRRARKEERLYRRRIARQGRMTPDGV